jgi:hypothetical protein
MDSLVKTTACETVNHMSAVIVAAPAWICMRAHERRAGTRAEACALGRQDR